MTQGNNHHIRYVTRLVLEAKTPLAVGSGEKAIHTDALATRDFNGLPYIPGTAILGVLRHSLDEKIDQEESIDIFGGLHIRENDEKRNIGSRLLVSDAFLAGENHKVMQTMIPSSDWSVYFLHFLRLPVREHVRLNQQSTSVQAGKFDEEVVYRGARFKCELELIGNKQDEDIWKQVNDVLTADLQIGGGLTKGFGQLKVISIEQRTYDLGVKDETKDYLALSADLNEPFHGAAKIEPKPMNNRSWETKKSPLGKGLFHLGTGYGDDQSGAINYVEHIIHWNDLVPSLSSQKRYVIPGSSVKGLLAHRVAWLYNVKHEKTIEAHQEQIKQKLEEKATSWLQMKLADIKEEIKQTNPFTSKKERLELLKSQFEELKRDITEEAEMILKDKNASQSIEQNPAVVHLFGRAQDDKNAGKTGKVVIEDIYISSEDVDEIIFDHNAIDRFTGGTIDGVLFNEKVISLNKEIELKWKVHTSVKEDMQQLLERAIEELQQGTVAIGGRTTKGHGTLQPA